MQHDSNVQYAEFYDKKLTIMATHKGKLELTLVGKDERPRLEPRVLAEESAKSYGDPKTENMLVFGDNLLALKALEQDFAGKIKYDFEEDK